MAAIKKYLKYFFSFTLLVTLFSFVNPSNNKFYKTLKKYCAGLPTEYSQIPEDRKSFLIEIGNYVIEKAKSNKGSKLLFICTSNSRRSHMAQIWTQTAALYYGIDSLMSYSGGSEATKVNINAIKALRRAGFSIETAQATDNPWWTVSPGSKYAGWFIFSKKYNNSFNPKGNFCAIMVCSEADKTCPMIDGAELRVSLPYDDPKYYDDTPSENQKYDERCRQIAREIFFMMDYVKQKLILNAEINKK